MIASARRSCEPLSVNSGVGELFENRETWQKEVTNSKALFEAVNNSTVVATDLYKKFEAVAGMNSDLRVRVSCLEQKVKDLEEQTQTESGEQRIGEVVCEVNQFIPQLVLDPVVGPDHYITKIKDMESALRGDDTYYSDIFESEEQRKYCQEQWETLKTELGWNDKVFKYMRVHKRDGGTIASVEKEIACATTNTHIKLSDREAFQNLIGIHEKLVNLLNN